MYSAASSTPAIPYSQGESPARAGSSPGFTAQLRLNFIEERIRRQTQNDNERSDCRYVYANTEDMPKVLGGLGIAIVSTNQGVITDKEARRLGVGGEVLAFVW